MRTTPLSVRDPAPWFACRSALNPSFQFDTVAGRYVVLCFLESAGDSAAGRLLAQITARRSRFDDEHLCFFAVSSDPEDERPGRVVDMLPGIRTLWDFDRSVARLYGANLADGARRGLIYVLDFRLPGQSAVSRGRRAGAG